MAEAATSKDKAIEQKKCMTPMFRLSFPALIKPKAFQNQEPRYSCNALFPKSTDLKNPPKNKAGVPIGVSLYQAAKAAAKEKWGDKIPKGLRMPFKDGDEKDYSGYAGTIVVTLSSKTAPGVVDQKLNRVISEDDIYAGCWCRATVIAYAYDTAGNKGIGFALQNVQKVKDDEKFSGKKDAADDFDIVEDESDDKASYEESADKDADDDSLGF